LTRLGLFSFEIRKINEVEISQDKELLLFSSSFCVTDSGYYMVSDTKAANIKIYGKDGTLLKVLGRRGLGPGEFISPYVCTYKSPYFAVSDFRRSYYYIYEQKPNLNFVQIIKNFNLGLVTDLALLNDKILIAAYKTDPKGIPYSLFLQNLSDNKIQFLLPDERKYSCSSFQEYQKRIQSLEIYAIGEQGFCDYYRDNGYYAWEGDLKIFKINFSSHQITTFGKKTKNYVPLQSSTNLVTYYQKKQFKRLISERQKISYINGLFTQKDYVGVLFSNYSKDLSGWIIYLQLYSPAGNFLYETLLSDILVPTPSQPGAAYFFSKDNNLLYYMYCQTDNKMNDIYKIITFEIKK
jgi:hypothetical protein